MRLGCLFVLAPIIEMALLIWVGNRVGLLPTLGLVVSTGLLGAYLLRREGRRVLLSARQDIATGKVPAQAAMVGVAIAVGGAFLLTPGVLTDVLGVALLLPPSRAWMVRGIRKRIEAMIAEGRVQVMTWGVGGVGGTGAPGPRPPGRSEDDDRPPRPGEIIQD